MGHTDQHRRPITDADLDLLHRLHRGDTAAFGELYQRTVEPLTCYVADRLPGRDRSVADDLVHDAFCDALAEPAVLNADLLTSMLHLATVAVARHDGAQRRHASAAYAIYYCRAASAESQAPAGAPFGHPQLRHALNRLTALQRWAIQLRYVDEYPQERTAQAMGRSVVAVRALERRALSRLQAVWTV